MLSIFSYMPAISNIKALITVMIKPGVKEIIGENPMKHWEHNKIVCKLEIKDPNFRIQNKKIEYTNENIKDFEMHI